LKQKFLKNQRKTIIKIITIMMTDAGMNVNAVVEEAEEVPEEESEEVQEVAEVEPEMVSEDVMTEMTMFMSAAEMSQISNQRLKEL
jgi:hypothetical protein